MYYYLKNTDIIYFVTATHLPNGTVQDNCVIGCKGKNSQLKEYLITQIFGSNHSKNNHHIDKYCGDEKHGCTGGASWMYLYRVIKNLHHPHNTLHQSIDLTSPQ